MTKKEPIMVREQSRSVAGRDLPPIPPQQKHSTTLLLFYQYKEPEWTDSQHKSVLKQVLALGQRCSVTGRGRVAPEGLNCTLTGPPQGIRDFCQGLRDLDPLFRETDFKLTDGLAKDKAFKSLSIRKTKELVAYGLAGEKAPSLQKFAGQHLEADDYHSAMTNPDTVIVDVRNHYESTLGKFQPPPGGAQLLDPQMRNSIEFPKWLNNASTQQQLNGKTVLMYCTGGIRCERATALLNQMSAVNPTAIQPKAVYELRGGIERYLKTFPEGGFWKGKNYLFDKRMEQLPGQKKETVVEQETEARCCVCLQKWTVYRGKFQCSQGLCGVPVIVCDECRAGALKDPKSLTCELCKVGYKAPQLMPDLVSLKRKAEETVAAKEEESTETKRPKTTETAADRLFVARLPLTVTKTKLAALFGEIVVVHWMTDKRTGAFYGSCIVQLTKPVAPSLVEASFKVDKKKIKVSLARSSGVWPPTDYQEREYPPVGC